MKTKPTVKQMRGVAHAIEKATCTKPEFPIYQAAPPPAGEFHVMAARADHESPPLTECLDWLRTGKDRPLYHIWSSPGPEFNKHTHHVQIGHVLTEGDDLFVILRKCVELYRNLVKSNEPGAGGA